MREIWSEQRKLEIWLQIEILACEALCKAGLVPRGDLALIKARAKFDIERCREIEKSTNHDVIAFLTCVNENIGPSSRWLHYGMTSSDLLDTTMAVQIQQSAGILLADLRALRQVIARRAREHKLTPMIGRSHGIHAEPVTFGLKMALMYDEFGRAIQRLENAKEMCRVGKISGAVGTHAHLDPKIEDYVCRKLGLKAATLSTQIIQRDRHAEFQAALAVIGSSVERWATEFRHLQRTEVLEAEEFFGEGQKGSSAMPHKRNPITCERLAGLSRVLRGNALAAMENVALWHERDITHSSVERVIFPDSCTLLDYMLTLLTKVVDQLLVYPENMEANLWKSKGLFFSQSVLLALVKRGATREEAYKWVQDASMKTWRGTDSLLANMRAHPEISKRLLKREIEQACDLKQHFKHVNWTFKKLGIE
jgi:adenylosuccinate lyase